MTIAGLPIVFALPQPVPRLVGIALGLIQGMVQLVASFVQILTRLLVGALQFLAQLVTRFVQPPFGFLLRVTALAASAIRVVAAASAPHRESQEYRPSRHPRLHARFS
jgi:hypothetical protein